MNKCYLVGGPSRNGKTALINSLYENKGTVRGLPVEALLDRFYYRFYPKFNSNRKIILEDYLKLKRYTNEKRTETASPIEYFSTPLESVGKEIGEKKHHIEIIFDALNLFAKDNNAFSWAVCDLHAERLFDIFKKYCPKLHLIIILRDPREALCANLYWRTYPQKNNFPKRVLEYRLLLWIFSAQIYLHWKDSFPDDVSLFSFNALLDKNSEHSKNLSKLVNLPPEKFSLYFKEIPFYSFENNKFFTPEKEWKPLLGREELDFIEDATSPYVKACSLDFGFFNKNPRLEENSHFENLLKTAASLCKKDAVQAKDFIEINANEGKIRFYKNLIQYRLNELKRLIKLLPQLR